jgi:ribonuclease Z
LPIVSTTSCSPTNGIERYDTDLVFEVTELHGGGRTRSARFRFKRAFARDQEREGEAEDGIVARGEGFEVRASVLEHHGPCLGFAVAEPLHVNVWRNRLEERGLTTGPWLQELKRAILEGRPDEAEVALPDESRAPLGTLRDLVSLSEGQKIAYVTDVADTPANREAIAGLAEAADLLFIESRFAAADVDQARERAHLTTRAAGEIGCAAGVRRLEAFHFSPRYEDEATMLAEVEASFRGAGTATLQAWEAV